MILFFFPLFTISAKIRLHWHWTWRENANKHIIIHVHKIYDRFNWYFLNKQEKNHPVKNKTLCRDNYIYRSRRLRSGTILVWSSMVTRQLHTQSEKKNPDTYNSAKRREISESCSIVDVVFYTNWLRIKLKIIAKFKSKCTSFKLAWKS